MHNITQTVAITDYQMKSPTLAKVIVSFTGSQTKDELRAALSEKFEGLAAPVEDSFRIVRAGVAVGFVRANKEVRVVNDKELRASYRVMSSNIMMDNADKTLWEVREGKAGKFLARHGHEDLSELVNASVNRRTDIPAIRHIQIAKAAPGEFVSYVSKTGDMDHGFCVASSDKQVKVVSMSSRSATVVDYDVVTAISQVPIHKAFVKEMATAGISRQDKQQQIEYWTKLYSWAPEYLDEKISQVNEGTLA
jgi:hypothetical protein